MFAFAECIISPKWTKLERRAEPVHAVTEYISRNPPKCLCNALTIPVAHFANLEKFTTLNKIANIPKSRQTSIASN